MNRPVPRSGETVDGTDHGFTLVEVLAALAIFAVGALALVQVSAENTRTARIVETRALASVVADNQMADALTRPEPLELGVRTDGVSLGGRQWQVRETLQRTPNPVLNELVVDVAVTQEGREPRAITQLRAYVRTQGR